MSKYAYVVDTSDDASMDETYVTYVDDEHVVNHDDYDCLLYTSDAADE